MAWLTDSSLLDAGLAVALVLWVIYWLITYNDDYWDRRGVPNVKRGFLWRTITGQQSQGDQAKEIYFQFKGERFVGFFQVKKPMLMIRDVELVNRILVKDFAHFQDRGQPQAKNDPLSFSLFNLRGQVWRALRYKLTPTFTTGKLKGMFEQMSNCGDNLIKKIDQIFKDKSELESKTIMFDYTLDVISSCAFGVQFETGSPHSNMLKSSTKRIFNTSPILFFRVVILIMFPKLGELLNIRLFPKDIAEYFLDMTKATAKYRKENNVQRNDYFQLLLTLKEQEETGKDLGLFTTDATEDDDIIDQMRYAEKTCSGSSKMELTNTKLMTDYSICGNSFIFLLAGSESTSNTLSMILYEVARHPDYQKVLQEEVDAVLKRHHGTWSYDALKEMTYLDQIIQESQRLHPLLPFLIRECVEPYRIPDSDVVIEKGALVVIPVTGLQSDPAYYPNPEVFDPDRFKGNNFKPNPTFLPFGDGPRICIALRFAVMKMKNCVAKILSQYEVGLSPRTQVPLKLKVKSFVPAVDGGIWLTFRKRSTIS